MLTDAANSSNDSAQPLLDSTSSTYSDYSTTVIRGHSATYTDVPPSLSSILTIRPSPSPNGSDDLTEHPLAVGPHAPTPTSTDSMISIESYHTASSSSIMAPSLAAATEGGSTIRGSAMIPMVHRFTLIKPGSKRSSSGGKEALTVQGRSTSPSRSTEAIWSPLELFFSSTLLSAKCDVCAKRLGWKPVLECDDCGMRYASSDISFVRAI